MGTREAYRIFIRHMVQVMVEEGKINLTEKQIGDFISGAENDHTFYEQLEDFLKEYIEDFGENYDLY